MSVQLLSPVGLLRDHAVVLIHHGASVPARTGGRWAVSVGHLQASLLNSLVHSLNMVDIIDEVGVNLHLVTVLIDLWVSLVSLSLLSAVAGHLVKVLLFVHFVLIFYFQLASWVNHALNCDSGGLFVNLWVIIDWPFVRRRVLIRHLLASEATDAPVVFVF